MNRTAEEIYQDIARVLSESAPAGWVVARVFATVGSDTGQARYECVDANGEERSFEPPAEKQYRVFVAFRDLLELMVVAGQPLWTAAMLELKSSGEFRLGYRYLEEGSHEPQA